MKAWEATVRKTQAVARKRANSFFGSHSMCHSDDGDDSDEDEAVSATTSSERRSVGLETYMAEKVLPNGEYYSGQWLENFPHGHGRYLWVDGCMYVGEWYKGKTMGRGRFSWPSGATYEGEFKSGFMDGKGTYTGHAGDSYKGSWVMNLKHGQGVKSYENGDRYDGEWRRGLQEGQGTYTWHSGNSYSGSWRTGLMTGDGTFIWTDGKEFSGNWDDGLPSGEGTLTWPDGSDHSGAWSRDPDKLSVTYRPGADPTAGAWDPRALYDVELAGSRVCAGERVLIWPSQKKLSMWNSTKGGGEAARRLSVDGRASVGVERPTDRMRMWESDGDVDVAAGRRSNATSFLEEELLGIRLEDPKFSPGLQIRVPRVVKRQGETISKGHKNYDLMLNLQLGIRHSVGRPAPAASLDLKSSAFDPREKVWTRFPPEGSKHTPPHSSCDFKWKDYCPLVFRTLRKLFKVDPADYMLSICGNEALRELSSPGKSGSFFYLTDDDRYMIKTMKKAEVKVLIRMLSAYYNHFRSFENTLLIKFYGLHCVKLTGAIQKKVRFIIMGNLFCSGYTIHRRFDLKGSSLGRITDKPESEIDGTTILKDLDLNFIFRLQKTWFTEFCRQVDRDCEFLEQERIMDYSLLVGLHFRDVTSNGELIPFGAQPPSGGEVDSQSRTDMEQLLLDPSRWSSMRLGINLPARAERTIRKNDCEFQLVGEPTGELYEVVMFFGVIDILQDYDISKKLEHAYKSIQYDPTSISAVDPKQYSRRFRDFIYKVFVEESL